MSTSRFSRRLRRRGPSPAAAPAAGRQGFTLTELLIVIAIIAVLASLITAAAVRAMYAARRSRIEMEIKQMAGALQQFHTDYGAYPPNGMNPQPLPQNNLTPGSAAALVQADFQRMFKKAFPRHQEPPQLILALCGQNLSSGANLVNGMYADEALYFWLGGFSSDPQFPISGPGGPSFSVSAGEVLENRTIRYEFDRGRLGPRNDAGGFDASRGRSIQYSVDLNHNGTTEADENRQINFWQYMPSGSEQPFIYFDTSRHKPYQYDPYVSPNVTDVHPIKRVREGLTGAGNVQQLAFVDQKYQVLHCGLDDDWGSFGPSASNPSTTYAQLEPYLFPAGPFIGPTADTLANFTDGTLADAAEQ
ncbi:MAG: prepilin-type N-terminal cleavage/methylation domain-containing protein [Pirellulales bacterium]|nr:prepilin-type N-terminal cleavage/methylation domain-containing protein [Pirellulales bacterium]